MESSLVQQLNRLNEDLNNLNTTYATHIKAAEDYYLQSRQWADAGDQDIAKERGQLGDERTVLASTTLVEINLKKQAIEALQKSIQSDPQALAEIEALKSKQQTNTYLKYTGIAVLFIGVVVLVIFLYRKYS